MQRNIDLYPTHTAKFSSFYTYIDDVIIRSPYLHAKTSSYVYIDEFVKLLTGDLVNKFFMQNLPSIITLSQRPFALSLTVCQWHASTLMSIPVKAMAYLEIVQSVHKRMTNWMRAKSCQLSLASSICKWVDIKVQDSSIVLIEVQLFMSDINTMSYDFTYTGEKGEDIPRWVSSVQVTIPNGAFSECKNLQTVNLTECLIEVGKRAFQVCSI